MKKISALLSWWLPLSCLCLLAFWLQNHTFLHKDLAIIMHTAALMLKGQTYAHDIYEPNPPMIFFLNFLPVLMTKLTGIKMIYTLRLYLIALIILSATCSRVLFNYLFNEDKRLIGILSWGFALILLFLSSEAFGQREHFLVILATPYLFLAAIRLENKSVARPLAIMIGIMAGVGFVLKPFFLPTLLLVELLLAVRKKNLLAWLRPESLTICLITVFYVLTVILFYPAWWLQVMPLWFPYYQAIAWPWYTLFSNEIFLYCCTPLVYAWLNRQDKQNKAIKEVLALATLGYLVTFLVPRVIWFYHILPALSVACLYWLVIIGELSKSVQYRHADARSRDSALKPQRIGSVLLVLAVFLLPTWLCIRLLNGEIRRFHSDDAIHQLITLLNHDNTNTRYNFFSMTHQLTQLEYYTHAEYTGSIAFFCWEYARLLPESYSETYRQEKLSEAIGLLTRDLRETKPQYVFVDNPSSLQCLDQFIDFPKEYAKDDSFRSAWSHYRYIGTIKPYDIYRLQTASQ